jgi:hypothetical protein
MGNNGIAAGGWRGDSGVTAEDAKNSEGRVELWSSRLLDKQK